MTYIKGISVLQVWQEPFTPKEDEKRLKVLQSIAKSVSELRKLCFPAEGSLYYSSEEDDEPTIGPAFVCEDSEELVNVDYKSLTGFALHLYRLSSPFQNQIGRLVRQSCATKQQHGTL